MNKELIIIKTGAGGRLGTGHFQRMCTLASYLDSTARYSARIVIEGEAPAVPGGIEFLLTAKIPAGASMIIRDMRDSSAEEINSLKKTAPVLVIDDNGPGRACADHVIDLLPSPVSAETFSGMFIYGYNFIRAINSMNLYDFIKDIDISIYAGYDPDMAYVNSMLGLFPENASVVLFRKGEPDIISGRRLTTAGYADTLLRSKIFITHFGISMYEGDLAGCTLVVVNPSQYHSELTHLVKNRMNLIHAGEYSAINSELVRSVLSRTLSQQSVRIISSRSIRERISISLDYFTGYLDKICIKKER